MLPALIAALLVGVMPEIHIRTFGTSRVVEAAVQAVEVSGHMHLGQRPREMYAQAIENRTAGWSALFSALFYVVATLLSGMLMNISLLGAEARVTPRNALVATSVSRLAEIVLRIAMWGWAIAARGLDDAAAGDWTHVAQVNAASVLGVDGSAAFITFLAQVDAFQACAVAVSAVVLRRLVPGLSWPVTVAASLAWAVVLMLVRVALSTVVNYPLL
ncbi:MAG: hypothetical protein ABJE47_10835 [bacterium]